MSETVEDILREMRDAANLAPSAVAHENMLLTDNYYDDECQGWLTHYADRIEAAYRRDLQTMIEAGDREVERHENMISNLDGIIKKLKSELGEEAKWTRAELNRELAMNVELNNKLRLENARLNDAMSRVVGCTDSTCGEMDVCRMCPVAQYTGGAE